LMPVVLIYKWKDHIYNLYFYHYTLVIVHPSWWNGLKLP
jgi:hypothetical protein